MTMSLSDELVWRGQIKDKTFSGIKWLDEAKTFYLGVDCSSDSLTVGNLAVFMMARRLRKHGWKAVLLVGGATSLIGDPGGKEEERELKTYEEIKANSAAIKKQVEQIFSGMDFELVDNYEWFKDVKYLDFLRDVGKQFSMTELLQRDFISARIGQDGSGISYAEFSYSLIQGYDYWQLFKNQGVVLQIGGSDQWGNMLSGVSLIRKKENKEVHALSMPLVIDKNSGKKFGKSEEGAIWLGASKTTPNDLYQFWVNIDDQSVEDYLKVYTELEKTDIESVMSEFNKDRAKRMAQKKLALETTKLVHGEQVANAAREYAEGLSVSVSASTHSTVRTEVGGSIVDVLVEAQLASSKTEARQLLMSGGVYINDKQTTKDSFEETDFIDGHLKLRRGKALQNTAIIELK